MPSHHYVLPLSLLSIALLGTTTAQARDTVSIDRLSSTQQMVADQRRNLAENTDGQGFGPQSPRDISEKNGSNTRAFSIAPPYKQMNLCNIHFHKNAEHRGGEFTKFAGVGDGHGFQTGYQYSGILSRQEQQPTAANICPSDHGALSVGDTIEVHYVYSTAQVRSGATLGACLQDATTNPQLRVEAQVMVLVNDDNALDFTDLAAVSNVDGYHQAPNILNNMGTPVQYTGSTTGPSYNEKGSPLQVTWNVRPKVAKVDIASVGQWCEGNEFDEDHAHGVRNLVINPDLLSPMN